MLSAQEAWLNENKGPISAAIQEGWQSAQRGELLSEPEVRSKMAVGERAWLDSRK